MGRSGECAGIRPLLGVYVTGAIAPADRAVVVRHLASCEWCRDELAGLAALPGLLRRLPLRAAARAPGGGAAAPGPEAGEALLGRVLSRIGARRRRRRWAVTAAVTVLATTAAVGWALRPASPPPGLPAGTILRTAGVGGVTVLTDAAGFTLYWFGPDTATTSKCTGSCSRRWPPVTGPVTAGTGVSGAVGWISRPDGAIQATYDGHPLYTASVDTAPGEARGNGVTASGGRWHEVTVRGAAAPASSPSPGSGSGGGYGLPGACSGRAAQAGRIRPGQLPWWLIRTPMLKVTPMATASGVSWRSPARLPHSPPGLNRLGGRYVLGVSGGPHCLRSALPPG